MEDEKHPTMRESWSKAVERELPLLREEERQTLEELDRESFDRVVDAIVSARKIYIIGVRSSASVALFLHFYFNLIFDNVVLVSASTASEIFESLLRVGGGGMW